MTELIGMVASVFIIIALLFQTNTYRSALLLRSFNALGSLIFVVYGLLLPAYSTAFLNIVALIINIYRMLKLKKEYDI